MSKLASVPSGRVGLAAWTARSACFDPWEFRLMQECLKSKCRTAAFRAYLADMRVSSTTNSQTCVPRQILHPGLAHNRCCSETEKRSTAGWPKKRLAGQGHCRRMLAVRAVNPHLCFRARTPAEPFKGRSDPEKDCLRCRGRHVRRGTGRILLSGDGNLSTCLRRAQ